MSKQRTALVFALGVAATTAAHYAVVAIANRVLVSRLAEPTVVGDLRMLVAPTVDETYNRYGESLSQIELLEALRAHDWPVQEDDRVVTLHGRPAVILHIDGYTFTLSETADDEGFRLVAYTDSDGTRYSDDKADKPLPKDLSEPRLAFVIFGELFEEYHPAFNRDAATATAQPTS